MNSASKLDPLLFKPQQSRVHRLLWLSAALLVSIIFSLIAVQNGLQGPDIIHHDARLHIVWLQRYFEPQLFPGDYIADYFQSFAPKGYKALYWSAVQLGIEPLVLAKFLPIPLSLLTSFYCFEVCLQIFPIPAGAFITVLILNQGIWFRDDIISATPRAFALPLFVAFLCYLLKQKIIPCLAVMLLQGMFYPILILLEVGILIIRLCHWTGQMPPLSTHRLDYMFVLGGLIITLIIFLPNVLNPPDYGSIVTAAQMRDMPEFYPNGRTPYFGAHPIFFWTKGRGGIRIPVMPPVISLATCFPFLLRKNLAIVKWVNSKWNIFWQIVIPSLGLYILAHIFLLKLYFPSRYTYYSFRIVLTIIAGISVTILLEMGLRFLIKQWQSRTIPTARQISQIGVILCLAGAILTLPSLPSVFLKAHYWHRGQHPVLYQFLRQQPLDTVVASLSEEADNLPSLTQRSVFTSRNTAIAFHTGYYAVIRQRIMDLMSAQYHPQLKQVQAFIQTYGIDFWLLDRQAFTPDYIAQDGWLQQYQPIASEAISQLQSGTSPALIHQLDRCSIVENKDLVLLEAQCILAQD